MILSATKSSPGAFVIAVAIFGVSVSLVSSDISKRVSISTPTGDAAVLSFDRFLRLDVDFLKLFTKPPQNPFDTKSEFSVPLTICAI